MSSRLSQAIRMSWCPIGLVALAGLGAGGAAQSQQAPSALAGDDLVRVTVAVEQPDGSPVSGLTREDFDVVSDGQARMVQYFSAADEPVAFVLLMDGSASNPISGGAMNGAVERALRTPRTSPDRVRVVGVARAVVLSPRFATDPAELRLAARRVLQFPHADQIGPSPLWDGVDTAVKALEAERGRRAIVMITDGRATGNVLGMAEVTTHAIVANVSINVIGVPTGVLLRQNESTLARVRPTVLLEQMAADTGGAYAELRAPGDVARFLVRAVSRLHELYTLGFPPVARDGRMHGIAVRVKRAGVTVRARAGYVADRPRPIPPG
jgi:VWFA-related protein